METTKAIAAETATSTAALVLRRRVRWREVIEGTAGVTALLAFAGSVGVGWWARRRFARA